MVDRLIVDDIRTFKGGKRTDYNLHVTTIKDAKAALQGQGWDELWLDFDMGPDEDMIPFARNLVNGFIDYERIDKVYVHSMSPVGRMYLMSTLSGHFNTVLVPISLIKDLFDVEY
jgi:hypothetical protein